MLKHHEHLKKTLGYALSNNNVELLA
ncbi:hypothetical protein DSUL_120008 [Desulfovibrionales bacterium]